MYDLIDINFDARRAEIQYRTSKLAGNRKVRLADRRWWVRTATTPAATTTN